jgi:hypothetical protein
MKQVLIFLAFVCLALSASAQTKINAVTLIKPGGNNTVLNTDGTGTVIWQSLSSLFNEGVAIDITGQTIGVDPTTLIGLGATPAGNDYFIVYDLSATTTKSVTFAEILAGYTHTISDGTNTQVLDNGNTLLFNSTGTDGYDFTVSATDRVTFSYDFTELTNLASIDNANDRLIIYDASATTYHYINPSQIAGSTYSFTLSDGTNTQAIDNGNTFLFSDAANGIDATVGATDQVVIDLDINELTTDATPDFAADYIPTYDASAGAERKVLLSNLVGASENNVTIASNTAANTNIASGLTLSGFRYLQVFLDGVKQRQTTDWVTSGNNIQFTFATLANEILTVVGFK